VNNRVFRCKIFEAGCFLFSLFLAVTKTLVSSLHLPKRGDLCQFLTQNHPSNSFFSFPFIEISDFHIFFVFLFWDFDVFVRCWFVLHLCATLFVCFYSLKYLIGSDCQISFDPMQIQLTTLASSSMLQIQRHLFWRFKYSHMCRHLYFVVLCYLTWCCESVHKFILLFLANLHYIDVLNQFEWMNIIYFVKKKIGFYVFFLRKIGFYVV